MRRTSPYGHGELVVVVDCADLDRAATFWTAALGDEQDGPGSGHRVRLALGDPCRPRRYLRDVADHLTRVNERIDGFRVLLRDILTVNATPVAQRQNEEMKLLSETSNAQNEEVKKISAWAAILFRSPSC